MDRRQTLTGMGLMVAFAAIAPWIDVLAKLGAGALPPAQYSLVRFLAQALVLFPVLLALGRRWRPAPGLWPVHLGRGAMMALAGTAFIAAVQAMPLADAMAIFFIAPLLLTAVSGLVLGERVGWRRLSACLIGFGGALIVVRPSFFDLGPVALLPWLAACGWVVYLLLTRYAARTEGVLTMQAWSGLAGAAFLAIAMAMAPGVPAFAAVWPTPFTAALMAGGAAAAIISHLCLVGAFARAPASLLAPLQYLELVTAATAGLVLFADFPDPLTWVGIAIIVGAGLYVIWRESR